MRRVREVLRLHHEAGLSAREVARSCGIARSTVAKYLGRAAAVGLTWPLPAELNDDGLERALFGSRSAPVPGRGLPEVAYLKRELAKPHTTLMLLWTEYKRDHPDGYQYTQFCEYYRRGVRRLDPVLRREHRGGQEMFVDWPGHRLRIVDGETGEARPASLFVAVLGASSYTFAELMPDQRTPSWIRGHVHAYAFFRGVPAVTVVDNTKTAVQRACRYEPELNPLYADMAAHYGTAVLPSRVRRPRDNAKAEAGVLVAERWILAALRNRIFFSESEANAEIRQQLLPRLNERRFRHLNASRRELYEQLDRPALRPLPAEPYRWVGWKQATVHVDYHVEVDHHFYSVPYQLVGERVDVRYSMTSVEVLHRHRRVASHLRSYEQGRHTTLAEHMPSAHRRYAEWTPARILAWAAQTGPATAALAEGIMARRPHPEQGFRACLGLMHLGRAYSAARLEAACARALDLRAFSYRIVRSMLRAGLDRAPTPRALALPLEQALHENVRGSAYYEEDDR